MDILARYEPTRLALDKTCELCKRFGNILRNLEAYEDFLTALAGWSSTWSIRQYLTLSGFTLPKCDLVSPYGQGPCPRLASATHPP